MTVTLMVNIIVDKAGYQDPSIRLFTLVSKKARLSLYLDRKSG